MDTATTTAFRLRPARIEDAAEIARLANALNHDQGSDESPFTAELVRRDGFGPDPAFSVILAERPPAIVGYALYHPFYNSDLAARGLWLTDLFVEPDARGLGIGRALLAALAAETLARGMTCLWWGVYAGNHEARRFYAGLGARDEDARILQLEGEALGRLAKAGGPG